MGIHEEEKQKIFGKGFGKNTGLGLFLSNEILTISGFTIKESGTYGTGARFRSSCRKENTGFREKNRGKIPDPCGEPPCRTPPCSPVPS